MKLREWLDIWLNKYIKYNLKFRSFVSYSNIIKNHIVPKLGEFKLDDLTPQILQNFVNDKLERGNLKTGAPLAKNTVIVITNVLKQAIEEANLMEVTTKNCSKKIKMPQQEETKVTAFERNEQERLIGYCLHNKKTNYVGIALCLYTGIRIGELLALTWEDIDFEKGHMTISKTAYQSKKGEKIQILVDTPKTKNSNRVIPLPKQILVILKRIKKKTNSRYIITTRTNGMVGTRSYQRTFERILLKLGISYKNFHSLRHTFATRALEFGMDVKTVSEILGHKNPLITLNRYTHSLMSYKMDMMNRLGKSFGIA